VKALVTGASGFLGTQIVRELLRRGGRVRAFCRRHVPLFDEPGVEWHQGDVRDFDAVRTACRGVDVVFHVAALPTIWGSWKELYSVNTLGTEAVLAACRFEGVRRLVYTSSASVVFDDHDHVDQNEDLPYATRFLCHYPKTKTLAEQSVLAANGRDGLHTVALRPHLIWGPGDNHLVPRLLARAQTGRLWRVGDGTNRVSTSFIDDLAAAHVLAAERLDGDGPPAGRAYFVTDAEPVNLWRWIDELLQRAGLPPVQRQISARAAWRLGLFYELLYGALRIRREPPLTRFLAQQLAKTHTYSSQRAARDFGYQPRATYAEGMRRLEPQLLRQPEENGCLKQEQAV